PPRRGPEPGAAAGHRAAPGPDRGKAAQAAVAFSGGGANFRTPVAPLAEQRSPKPQVGGSSPSWRATQRRETSEQQSRTSRARFRGRHGQVRAGAAAGRRRGARVLLVRRPMARRRPDRGGGGG